MILKQKVSGRQEAEKFRESGRPYVAANTLFGAAMEGYLKGLNERLNRWSKKFPMVPFKQF